VTFTSPFQCENLKIHSVQDRGVDTSDPLYICLNENPWLNAFNEIRIEALKAYQDARAKACEKVPEGSEKLSCQNDWNQTPEAKTLLDKVKETQEPVAIAWGDCYTRFPRE
jgi:hypothetical protein